MPRFWSIVRQKPVRASAATGLHTSAAFPTAGATSLDNSQGASQAVAELLDSLDAALAQVSIEDDPTIQLTAQLEQLDRNASSYANSSLDFCSSKKSWECTADMANLIKKAWVCAETVYERNITTPSEELKGSGLNIEWYLPSSLNGNIKATTLTTFIEPPSYGPGNKPTTYLVIAVRGSASTVDQLVNLNGEPRDASLLFKHVDQSSSSRDQIPVFQAHAGFLNSARELLAPVSAQIEKQLSKDQKFNILFTGHSAGGAVAALLHLALRVKFADVPSSCITFGSPPIAKLIAEEDKVALDRIMMQAPILNIVNEYDLVSRLDGGYIRSIIQLYNSCPPNYITRSLYTAEETVQKRWPLPPPDLQHLGSIVVLKTELPDLQLHITKPSEAKTRVTAWSIPPESISELVFCQLQVHKRTYYREKIEQLADSNCDGTTSTTRASNTPAT